jgi:uncharacterized protein (TIGR02391 family)
MSTPDAASDESVDPELWAFVAPDIEREAWGKAVSQACIYFEDRIRKLAGGPAEEVGERLMTAVFGENGEYRLGVTDGEKQGWHRIAMGISMALRNAANHRIDDRPDHKRYAFGVISTCSLVLTQLKFEHGNRFHLDD